MRLLAVDTWLRSPADRDVIRRWTVGGPGSSHEIALPPPPDPERFEILAVGDTGDSEAAGPQLSPQDAVAGHLALDAALPGSRGEARLVLHTGDVVYMAGEKRLYDRNFRRPYAPFLMPQSTVSDFVFRLPFLPVPGNHDYYDLGDWLRWLARVPILGAGLRALAHELFSFSIPQGGSEEGRAYMSAFLDIAADTTRGPLPYLPGERTRLPNRYYRFRFGIADFFALDSNTLDAPPPSADAQDVRGRARERVEALQQLVGELDERLRQEQLGLDRWKRDHREQASRDPARLVRIATHAAEVRAALTALYAAVGSLEEPSEGRQATLDRVGDSARSWDAALAGLADTTDPDAALAALREIDRAADETQEALCAAEGCLLDLPEGDARRQMLAARDELERTLGVCLEEVAPSPREVCEELRRLSEAALTVQRELALALRRTHYQPEDHDAEQLAWLREALEESARERPDAWRILYLHHPLYTTIVNHAERSDVRSVRASLLDLLKDRVHLVIAGHSHAFEWLRSSEMPRAGLFVTGGGGQVMLKRSLLDPRELDDHRHRYDALREAGLVECAAGGRGPDAPDGEDGYLYHYLRIEVSPEVLRVVPTGVRRLRGGYRRESPMPVYHAAEVPAEAPPWEARLLEAVEVRRGAPPRPVWA